MSKAAVWKPLAEDQLTWFRPSGRLTARLSLLDFTFEVYALTWGITRALESLYFPFYELRGRLIDGQLYLASVPSAFAERDLEAQLQRMRDSGLRFTRNIRATWERAIKGEVEEYNEAMAAFPPADISPSELADQLSQLRRTRGNQWFAATRAVFGPIAMLEHGDSEPISEDAWAVVDEALVLIRDRGTELLTGALNRVGQQLVQVGAIDRPHDVHWLEYQEVRDALRDGRDFRRLVAERSNRFAPSDAREGPATIGPSLPPDAPRMHLLREVLALVS
jgi:hypothetical protein